MGKSERILTIDIGASDLKLAEFRALKSGGIELTNFAVGSLGMDLTSEADRPAYVVTTLRDMLASKHIKPGPVHISISGQSVFSRFVRLPPVEMDKLHQIVLYEAQQNVPFPMDEVVWDYQLIGSAGQLDVMLAAVKTEFVEETTDCVLSGGLRTELVDVAPMALYNACRYSYDDLDGCTLVVDIGARSTDLIFIEEGFFFNRSIPVAGNTITQQIMREFNMDFPDAEEMKKAHAFVAFGGAYESPASEVADKVSKSVRLVMTRMHAEINRSINFYRSQQGGSQPKLLLLAGGSSIIPQTDAFLRDKLHVEVDYLNPLRNVVVSDAISEDEIANEVHLFGANVGLALRNILSCPIEINLLPEKVKKQQVFRKKMPHFYMAAAGFIIAILLWGFFYMRMNALFSRMLASVGDDVAALSAVESQQKTVEAQERATTSQLQQIFTIAEQREFWMRMMEDIRLSVPSGMWLTSVTPVKVVLPGTRPNMPGATKITKITLNGVGYLDKVSTAQPIREFRDKLRESPYFKEQTEITRQPSPQPGDYLREFQIEVALETPLAL